MKKGTIFRNLWAGHETYFIYQGPTKSAKCEAEKSRGYSLCNFNGKWKLGTANYYTRDLKDEEHFPVVGYIKTDDILKNAILDAIFKNDKGEHDV